MVVPKLQQQFATVSSSVSSLSNHSRINNIEITNVKQFMGENVVDMVIKLGQEVDVVIEKSEIDKGHRVNSTNKSKPKPIIVRLTSNLKKTELLEAIREKTKAGYNLTSESQGVSSKEMVFVNHHQTVEMKKIHYHVRKLQIHRSGCYEDGVIWVQHKDDSSSYVRNLTDLRTLYAKFKIPLVFEREV